MKEEDEEENLEGRVRAKEEEGGGS